MARHIEELYTIASFSTGDIVTVDNRADITGTQSLFRNIAQ
jgi:hypothetical protein